MVLVFSYRLDDTAEASADTGEPEYTVEARGYSAWELDGENNAMDFGRLLAARQARLTETKMPVWLKIQKIDFMRQNFMVI